MKPYGADSKFSDFMRGIEEEALAEGPEAVVELEALREHYRLCLQLARAKAYEAYEKRNAAKTIEEHMEGALEPAEERLIQHDAAEREQGRCPKGCCCWRPIPDTFIMCGEDGNYCSDECMRKAKKEEL